MDSALREANIQFDQAKIAFDNNKFSEACISFQNASVLYSSLPKTNEQTIAVADLCYRRSQDMLKLQEADNKCNQAQNAKSNNNYFEAFQSYQEAGLIYQIVSNNFENKKNNEKINEMASICLLLAQQSEIDYIKQKSELLCKEAENANRLGNIQLEKSKYKEAGDLFSNYSNSNKQIEGEIKLKAAEYYHKAETTNIKSTTTTNSSIFSSIFSTTTSSKPSEKEVNKSKDEKKPDWIDYSKGLNNKKDVENKKNNSNINKTSTTTTPVKSSSVKANRSRSTTPNGRGNTSNKDTNTHGNNDEKPNEYEEKLLQEMLDTSLGVNWNDIAGLSFAKQTLQEAVILPNLRPDLFVGLRSPPKGVLLYGPPGTGKTLLAKAVATESGFAFFSVSASAVTSKFVGEGEKLMKGLFSVARKKMPAVIFFDEIDSIMSARKESEHEASRRLKTEFMTQIDGATTASSDRILVMAATNIPWELDEAVLRRMVKRVYVPLPDYEARTALIKNMLKKQNPSSNSLFSFNNGNNLSENDLRTIVMTTEGYSGSDLTAVCQEAAMGPIREIGPEKLRYIKPEDVRSLLVKDFEGALNVIRPSVSPENLHKFTEWSNNYGSR